MAPLFGAFFQLVSGVPSSTDNGILYRLIVVVVLLSLAFIRNRKYHKLVLAGLLATLVFGATLTLFELT